MRAVTVITHRRPQETASAMRSLIRAADAAGVELRFSADETRKHALEPAAGIVTDHAWDDESLGSQLGLLLGRRTDFADRPVGSRESQHPA